MAGTGWLIWYIIYDSVGNRGFWVLLYIMTRLYHMVRHFYITPRDIGKYNCKSVKS